MIRPSREEQAAAVRLARWTIIPPRTQYLLIGPNRRRITVDFAWPQVGVIVEIDAYPTHATPDGIANDARRDAITATQGYTTYRVRRIEGGMDWATLEQAADEVNRRVEDESWRRYWRGTGARRRARQQNVPLRLFEEITDIHTGFARRRGHAPGPNNYQRKRL